MVNAPKYGRNARLVVTGGEVVAYGRNIKTSAAAESSEVYSMDATTPALSEPGNITFDWSCDRLAVDDQVWLNRLLNGTKFSLVFAPTGSPPVAPYETWTGCYVTGWDKNSSMADAILLSVKGKALNVTPTAS